MSTLEQSQCEPCRKGAAQLSDEEIRLLLREVPEWVLVERDGENQIERVFTFRNFAEAMAFTVTIGELAEEQGHHPALLTEWGKVTVTWWTHKIGGLHRNDFVMAARTNKAFESMS